MVFRHRVAGSGTDVVTGKQAVGDMMAIGVRYRGLSMVVFPVLVYLPSYLPLQWLLS
jgi:hypothetical protein